MESHALGAHESVVLKISDELKLVSMEDAYRLCVKEEEQINDIGQAYAKYPKKWHILDRGGNFTKVTRIVRSRLKTDLLLTQIRGSENLIATRGYPLIITNDSENTIEAEEDLKDRQYRSNMHGVNAYAGTIDYIKTNALAHDMHNAYLYEQVAGCLQTCKKVIDLDDLSDYDGFGWFMGMFIASGKYLKEEYVNSIYGLMILNQNKEYLERAAVGLYVATGIPSSVEEVRIYGDTWYKLIVISKALSRLIMDVFCMSADQYNINLPIDILNYPTNFQRGVLNGFLKGTTSLRDIGRVRKCMNQIGMLARINGVDGYVETTLKKGGQPLNNFTPHLKRDPYGGIAGADGDWNMIDEVSKITNTSYLQSNKWVYTISTESHSFIVNNIWAHM